MMRAPLVLLALAGCVSAAPSAGPVVVSPPPPVAAPSSCPVVAEATFPGDGEVVRLAAPAGASALALFRAPLAVNTDGAPTSYHPMDPLGQSLAINRFDNGISVTSPSGPLTPAEKLRRFEAWRDAGWVVPPDTRISWTNVIAARDGKPCVFASGPEAGYFGSLTALRNGLPPAQAGECGRLDQLDLRHVPAIVLRGGAANPLTGQGARKGDLVLAVNPRTGAAVPAVIGDRGNGERIGEGSVALNMALLGRGDQPRSYRQALSLDTGRQDMVIAVLPGTRRFQPAPLQTAESLAARVEAWAEAGGYGSVAGLASAALTCAQGL